jgi:hypothetical protein
MTQVKYSFWYENPNEAWRELAFFEPEPVFKLISSSRSKNTNYLKCPAFQDYYNNCFLLRSPIDITINISNQPNGNKFASIDTHNQKFFDDNIAIRYEEGYKHPILHVRFFYVFYADEPLMIELLSPSMHKTELQNNINIISGVYDISKWIRPVEFAFEVIDDTKPIVIKRGDPMYYVRFSTTNKISLSREETSNDLNRVVNSCTTLKNYVPNNTLDKNYGMGAWFINLFKAKMFKKKSKCPFNFLRRSK